MVTTKLATAEDLWALPDDGFHKYDLIRGKSRRMPSAGEDHGRVAFRLARPLFLRAESLGGEVLIAKTGYILDRDPDTVLAPNVAFIRRADLSPLGERRR